VLRPGRVRRDKRQIDVRLHGRGKLHLGLFRRFFQALQRHPVGPEIDALILFELRDQIIHDPLVEILSAQMRVAVGRFDFKHAVSQLQNGNVKRAAAQIEHRDLFILLFVQAVGQGRGRRLVDDAQNVQAGDLARVFGRLTLRIVKVSRNRDDGVVDFFSQIIFRRLLHFGEDHRGNFRRGVILAPHGDLRVAVGRFRDLVGGDLDVVLNLFGVIFSADHSLDGVNGIFRIGDRLPPGHLAHQTLAAFRNGDDGGRGAVAFLIGNHHRVSPFHNRHARIGCS